MTIIYYRFLNDLEGATGPIARFMKDLIKKRPDLATLVKSTLDEVNKSITLDLFFRQEIAAKVDHCSEPIYEFRIPKTRKGGVVRLYFGYQNNNNSIIHILAAELKNTKSPDANKIAQAISRYKETCL